MKKRLLIRCYYCDEKILVDFYDMRNHDSADKILKQNGWIFGVTQLQEGVSFDPLCHSCGREVVKNMIERGGGKIDPQAKKSLQKVYPDLFEGLKN